MDTHTHPPDKTLETRIQPEPTPPHGSGRPRIPRRSRRRRPRSLSAVLDRIIHRIPLPRLGRWGSLAAFSGLFTGVLAIGVVLSLTLRALLASDVLNPFEEDYGGPTATPNATPNPEFMAPTQAGWQGTDRVTVLLMGVDTRPSERGYRTRTDTMMLLSVDPVGKTGSMLSIPRDLYVDVPGYGLQRVNTAYPLGGADLAVETVQYNLGIRVNYYAIVEFAAFVTLVDEIGGIDLYVPVEIYDPQYPDQYYGYDPFYMPAGQQHMDGATALKYARTRHQDNDYERARRQQAVILAIRQKILSLNMLPQLIQKAPTLYAAVGDSVRTNMTLEQMIELALLAEQIPQEQIRSGVIDSGYIMPYRTPEGAAVSIPDRVAIGPLLEYIFWMEQ